MSAADAEADPRTELQQQITTVLARVLGVEAAQIDEQTSPDTVRSWDSITHFRLVSALEEQFAVRFALEEIQTMDTFAAIARVLEARTAPVGGAG